MLSTDKTWEKFGSRDPYFGVLADEKFKGSGIDRNRDEFFASGVAAVSQILDRYRSRIGELSHERALDHGCGVGRLTLPLARQFSHVVAVDVSPSMLGQARSNAQRAGVANVLFAPADDGLSKAVGEFDFVNSFMVLQHVRTRRGRAIMSALLGKVRPGGGLHVHLSIRTDALRSRALWWASHHVPGVKIWQNICAGRAWNAPAMQMNNYPLNHVAALLAAHGISEFFVSTERHAQFLTCSIFARKPE